MRLRELYVRERRQPSDGEELDKREAAVNDEVGASCAVTRKRKRSVAFFTRGGNGEPTCESACVRCEQCSGPLELLDTADATERSRLAPLPDEPRVLIEECRDLVGLLTWRVSAGGQVDLVRE